MIRPYNADDCRQLVAIHNAVFSDDRHSPSSFAEFVAGIRAFGGNVWVIVEDSLAGYAAVTPLPGLPHLAELDGCIAPERRRRGLGSQLWAGVHAHLQGSQIQQVSYGVQRMDVPAALFLQKQGFFVEHVEWILVFEDWGHLPAIKPDDRVTIRSFEKQTAVPLFCHLYERSFSGLLWDQPFSQNEVGETLSHGADLQFLMVNGEAIGFAWTRLDSEGQGEIEPVGILPEYQNRGFGRQLLVMAMRILRNRGANQLEIGAWRDNQRAIALYRSLGFRHKKSITYLAIDVS